MENREMPILHKPSDFGLKYLYDETTAFLFAGTSRQIKILFLRDLRSSVVKTFLFALCNFLMAGLYHGESYK